MTRFLAIAAALVLVHGGGLSGSELQFAANGQPRDLRLGPEGDNRVNASRPGRFVVKVFTGADTHETRLDRVSSRGDRLAVAGPRELPRLTFDLRRHERSVALLLLRIEGLPAESPAAVHFEITSKKKDVRILSLDFMMHVEQRDSTLRAEFNFLWHRKAGDPLGGFALYAARGCGAPDAGAGAPVSRRLLHAVQRYDDHDSRRRKRT